MKPIAQYTAVIFLFTSILIFDYVDADVLELKDGSVLNGQYKGGTQGTIRFQFAGQIQVIPVKNIVALTFSGGSSVSAPAVVVPKTSNKASPTATGPQTVSVGTVLLVRTIEEIGTHNKSEGQRFSAKLEGKLMAGSTMVAPAGAAVYGRVLTSKKGGIGARKAILELTLTEIMIDGQLKPIKTSVLKGEGKGGGLGRKLIKGAAIGALADGSSGAKTGAKVGVGIGILAGGRHAGMKSGTLIEFRLVESLKL